MGFHDANGFSKKTQDVHILLHTSNPTREMKKRFLKTTAPFWNGTTVWFHRRFGFRLELAKGGEALMRRLADVQNLSLPP